MKCPYCGKNGGKVIDSRHVEGSSVIRRRRQCRYCERRFTTYERVEEMPLMVVKSDSRREPFDRNKLLQGILKACIKRPISYDTIENIISDIEHQLQDYIMEVPSKAIGEMVLKRLKKLDEVAYVRFASVYRKFESMDSFFKELKKLKKIGVSKSR